MKTNGSALLDANAVIFDVDGTLVNTVDFHAEAWQRAFAEFGYKFDFSEIRAQIGKGGDQLMPVFLPVDRIGNQGKDIDAYRQQLLEHEYFPRVRGFPKVRELFDALIDKGIRVALGSSARADDLKVYKAAAGIDGIIMVETTSEDAAKSKPHPDIFNAAFDRLKFAPTRVIVVGDTPYDVDAAKKAGMNTIGLLCGGFSEQLLRDAGAVEVCRDPEHLLEVLDAAAR